MLQPFDHLHGPPLHPLQQVHVVLVLEIPELDAVFQGDNKVRLSHDLSEGEKKATQQRREKVLSCLKTLQIPCDQNKVPNIVVLGSGGGLRAMIAMLGTLVELKKQNLLDAVTYLCGVSGSTWCMSLLYGDEKWSENLLSLKDKLCEQLSNSSWHITKAGESLQESSKDELYSLTDFWASFLVYQILQQFDEKELADHKEASETGINPYPIYAAVDKDKLSEEGGLFPGLWGSAIGSMEENLKFIRESISDTFMAYQSTLLLLDLQLCAVSGSDPKEVFDKLLNILSGK
ncbi:cytosolic phospholipase A2 gamma [Grus japonensis]|uniref:Cytosolic phospholipase A2 gamma n=1 Tax=Grus japonensis TaxID=30415 RepID=A0ABC9XND8_GRUJA